MAIYYNNILCVSSKELADGIVTYGNLNKMIYRNKVEVVKRGGGEDNPSLIRWESMPERLRSAYIEKYGDPHKTEPYAAFTRLIDEDYDAQRFFAEYELPNGNHLTTETQDKYVANCKVLNAILKCVNWKRPFIKALGGNVSVNEYISQAVNHIKNDASYAHTLPGNARRLMDVVNRYKQEGYSAVVSKCHQNNNAAKVKDNEQESTLRSLLGNYRNLDNEQICGLYNMMAKQMGWKTISVSTVAAKREQWNLFIYGGNAGETAFYNAKQMLVKRSAPSAPMLYWTADGWDVELLYQKTTVDKNGHQVTTYHNRLTVVVVLDAFNKYPIGFAIGDQECGDLIRSAFRNAIRHTEELFGSMFQPAQVQTDHYGRGSLTSFYQSLTSHYTPARIKNAKSKVVEPYFKMLNHDYCQLEMRNWAGYGVKSDIQPNADMLNKIKKDFPDRDGCIRQIEYIIHCERQKKSADYVSGFHALEESKKHALSEADYLYSLCDSTSKTIRLQPMGICPTIGGVKHTYDCFDVAFRTYNYLDWTVKYDPDNLDKILVCGDNDRVRFVCEEKYVQPMALADRTDGDAAQLKRINDHNAQLRNMVLAQTEHDFTTVQSLMAEVGKDETMLQKVLLTDSRGQHKNNRNAARLGAKTAKAIELRMAEDEVAAAAMTTSAYLNSRVNIEEYI